MSTRKTNLTLTNLAAKKLLGKAHTSNLKDVSNEGLPSNVTVASEGVFSEPLPNSPGTEFYTMYSSSAGDPITVEKVYFKAVEIISSRYDADGESGGGSGDETSEFGPHGFYLQLPSNYETTSSNPNRGTGSFVNNSILYDSRGGLQIVPPFMSTENPNKYQLKLWNAADQEISFTDNIDWTVDYYAGTIFIQDYTSSVSGISKVPVSASAYIYVGKYLDEKLTTISSSAGNDIIVKDEGSTITSAVTSFNFVGSSVTAGASGNDVTITIADSIAYSRRAVTSTITSSVSDAILGVSGNAAIDIRLPSAGDYTAGQYFTVKDESGASDTKNITILTSGSQTIDGASSIILESPYAAVNIYSNGTDKFFIY
jgi:hypothetical protein